MLSVHPTVGDVEVVEVGSLSKLEVSITEILLNCWPSMGVLGLLLGKCLSGLSAHDLLV